MLRHLAIFLAFAATAAPSVSAPADTAFVRITTELGDIDLALFPQKAPITVANFLQYVKAGHYEGGSFFRTVRDDNQPDSPVKIDVIQAGVHPWMENFARDPIPLERTSETGIRHRDGTISMARGKPDTATSSFFICIGDQPELDFGGRRNPDGQGFAAFGQVVGGMDVVHRIHQTRAKGQAIMPPVRIVTASVQP
ncbi:MAG: peptidylprolyl isomerase [Rhodothermales bacterium]